MDKYYFHTKSQKLILVFNYISTKFFLEHYVIAANEKSSVICKYVCTRPKYVLTFMGLGIFF